MQFMKSHFCWFSNFSPFYYYKISDLLHKSGSFSKKPSDATDFLALIESQHHLKGPHGKISLIRVDSSIWHQWKDFFLESNFCFVVPQKYSIFFYYVTLALIATPCAQRVAWAWPACCCYTHQAECIECTATATHDSNSCARLTRKGAHAFQFEIKNKTNEIQKWNTEQFKNNWYWRIEEFKYVQYSLFIHQAKRIAFKIVFWFKMNS